MTKTAFRIATLALLLVSAPVPPAFSAAVEVTESDREFPVTEEDGSNPRAMVLHQIVLENAYLRVVILPRLGGRVAEVFSKAAAQQLFAVRPILWTPTLYTNYGSQLGGIEVNFPCFHHGNNYRDQWNWHVQKEDDGAATVFVGWTHPELRQRIVHRLQLRPEEAILRSHYRFSNLNPLPMGFAPWTNTFFPYRKDLQYIIPSPWVGPHGFNDSRLDVMPWPWPNWDDSSVCFWRNISQQYNSIFAVALQENFNGAYFHDSDCGVVRIFDRTVQPGVKMWCIPPADQKPGGPDYCEMWFGPTLVHEDARWWDAYAVREYDEMYYPVFGIGGYRYANEHGALNIERGAGSVEIGACVTRAVPGAVISLSSIDGEWWRQVADLTPRTPLRIAVKRTPGRMPLHLRVRDNRGRILVQYDQRPDPGPQVKLDFSGSPLWSASPLHKALKAEQYPPLWRASTEYETPGIRTWRKLLEERTEEIEARLGLARCLIPDAQLRSPEKPKAGTADEIRKLTVDNLAEAEKVLAPIAAQEPRAAAMLGEVKWRQGDVRASAERLSLAEQLPLAAIGLARARFLLGDDEGAQEAAAIALRSHPACSPVVQLAAALHMANGEPTEALHLLQALLEQDPLDAVSLHLLARAYDGAGNVQESTAMVQRLMSLQAQTDVPVDIQAELRRLGMPSR